MIVTTLKNSHQIVYLLTMGKSNELLAMPNSRLTYQNLSGSREKDDLWVRQDNLSLKNDAYIFKSE